MRTRCRACWRATTWTLDDFAPASTHKDAQRAPPSGESTRSHSTASATRLALALLLSCCLPACTAQYLPIGWLCQTAVSVGCYDSATLGVGVWSDASGRSNTLTALDYTGNPVENANDVFASIGHDLAGVPFIPAPFGAGTVQSAAPLTPAIGTAFSVSLWLTTGPGYLSPYAVVASFGAPGEADLLLGGFVSGGNNWDCEPPSPMSPMSPPDSGRAQERRRIPAFNRQASWGPPSAAADVEDLLHGGVASPSSTHLRWAAVEVEPVSVRLAPAIEGDDVAGVVVHPEPDGDEGDVLLMAAGTSEAVPATPVEETPVEHEDDEDAPDDEDTAGLLAP